MKKSKLLIICSVIIAIVICNSYISLIRQEFAKKIDSLSVIDARNILEQSVKKEFSEFDSFRLVSEGYVKESDYKSYQLIIEADNNIDNIIIPTYSIVEKNGEKIVEIDNGRKRLERKIPLIQRLESEYTELIKKELNMEERSYFKFDTDISVESPFFQINYNGVLPEGLKNGMKFNKNIDLEWEVCFVFHIDNFNDKDKFIMWIYNELVEHDYRFCNYNFTFVKSNGDYEMVYGLTKEEIENDLLQCIESKKVSGETFAFHRKY